MEIVRKSGKLSQAHSEKMREEFGDNLEKPKDSIFNDKTFDKRAEALAKKGVDEFIGSSDAVKENIAKSPDIYKTNSEYGEQSKQQAIASKISTAGSITQAVKLDVDSSSIQTAKQVGSIKAQMEFINDEKAMNKFISSLEKKGMNVDYLKGKSGTDFLKAQAEGSALRFYGSDSIVGEDGKVYNGAIASVGKNKGKVTGSVKGGLNSLIDDTENVKNWGNMDMARLAVKGIDAGIYKATGKHLSSDQQDKLAHQLASNEEFLGNVAKGHWGKALAATGVQQTLKAFGYNLDKDQLAGAAFATMTTVGVGSGMAVEKGLNAARGKRVATQDIILHDQVDSKGNPKVIKKGQEFNLGTLSDTDKEIARKGSRVADTTVTKGVKETFKATKSKLDKFRGIINETPNSTSDSSPQENNTNNKSKVQDSSEHTTPPNNEFKESVAQKNEKLNTKLEEIKDLRAKKADVSKMPTSAPDIFEDLLDKKEASINADITSGKISPEEGRSKIANIEALKEKLNRGEMVKLFDLKPAGINVGELKDNGFVINDSGNFVDFHKTTQNFETAKTSSLNALDKDISTKTAEYRNIMNNPLDNVVDIAEDTPSHMPKSGFSRLATHLGIVGTGIELVTAAKTYNDYINQGMSPLEAAGNTVFDIADDTTFNKSTLLKERKVLIQWWDNYLDNL